MLAELFKLGLLERGSEALEALVPDLVGLTREHLSGAADGHPVGLVLHLDNVLAGNGRAITGLEDRGGATLALAQAGRSGNSQGQKRQNSGGLHCDGGGTLQKMSPKSG